MNKIKVYHIVSGDLWAGAEVQVYTLLKCLSRNEDLELGAIVHNPGELADRLKKLGIQVWVLPEAKLRFPSLLWRATKILREFRPHLVHSHRYKENLIAAIAGRAAGARSILRTQHGAFWRVVAPEPAKTKLYRAIDRVVARYATDRIICVSENIRERFEKCVPARLLETIPNGILLNGQEGSGGPEAVRREWNIPPESRVIGTICRLVEEKGLDLLLRAAAMMRAGGLDAYFMIVGDGPERENLQNLASSLGIADRVRFTGFRQNVRDYHRAFDIFALTSLHEGTPMALLEAMHEGTPCVATDVGGVPDILGAGECGVLVPPRSPEILAQACGNVLNDAEYRKSLIQKAHERVLSRYDAESAAGRVADLYELIMGESHD